MKESDRRRAFQRILFEEKPAADTSFFLAIVVVLLFDDLVVALLLSYLDVPREVAYALVFTNVLVIAFVYSYVHFRSVRLTNTTLYVRFGISRSSIPVSEIRSISVSDPPAWSKMGPGVSGWRGRKVYCFRTGSPFVMIEHGLGRQKELFLNVDRLSEFVARLKEMKER